MLLLTLYDRRALILCKAVYLQQMQIGCTLYYVFVPTATSGRPLAVCVERTVRSSTHMEVQPWDVPHGSRL